MTEDEAKGKWCPFVRVQDEAAGQTAVNRAAYDIKGNQRCIASSCMAWRWDRVASDAEFKVQAETGDARAPLGFCGLAGAPR